MIKRWLLLIASGFALYLIFLIISFPFDRLGPKISREIEIFLSRSLPGEYHGEISGLHYQLPIDFGIDQLRCNEMGDPFLSLQKIKLLLIPYHQSFSANMGSGHIEMASNMGITGSASQFRAMLKHVNVKTLFPMVYEILRSFTLNLPLQPEIDGYVTGQINLPLKNFLTGQAFVKLNFDQLRLPSQPTLDLIGLSELKFTNAKIDLEMKDSQLKVNSLQFLSSSLSGKLEGDLNLNPSVLDSSGNLVMKWKVQKSDALMGSLLGPQLLNAPCPSPDNQGFCTRRITKLSEFTQLFGGATPGRFR